MCLLLPPVLLLLLPQPYGDLAAQAVQRFESVADLDKHHTTHVM
jgi:predicted GTPase